MLIAAGAEGCSLDSAVSEKFENCRCLLIVETDDMSFESIEKTEGALTLAERIVERDCEAIITGEFTMDTFNLLADACVTRYRGTGMTVKEALRMMDMDRLEYIRSADGSDTCHSDHGGGECNCEEHD